ncbi:Adenylosuccinate lyase [Hibiscus syriacus]|uniref:Adenylosuccinate lyase n=1 Tax=Hibiscus syriacus TaxID=106335 RepID=A0A6A2XGL7_HIBSY|nr:Adenylosuccinate lyase [Hibiscus syriacus]
MAIFVVRLSREMQEISRVEMMGKFAGAVGNYNAHLVAYPTINWPQIAEEFVTSLGLTFNPYATQRDLTDSTILRNMGGGLGHSLLAYKNALQGIGKLQVNKARLKEDLNQAWEVLAEPIQTVIRRYNVPKPCEGANQGKGGY